MTKPMVFNYADHERALEEIAKLKEDIANLQIRCRIAESENRDCKSCKHNKADGCSRWDCEYVPRMDDLISRQDAIEAVIAQRHKAELSDHNFALGLAKDAIRHLPSADAVEVVRCRDCKHRQTDECPMFFEEQIDIDEGDGYHDTDYIFHDYTQDEGYCSWGERREGGEA